MNVATFKSQLKDLRLSTARTELDEILTRHKKAVSLDWIVDLFAREIDARKERSIENRLKKAAFPEITTLDNFDWKFNPGISKDKITELATLDFIDKKQIALFLGAPGIGKTHLAIAIGVLAVQSGYRVFYTSGKQLSNQITIAKLKNNLDALFRKILSVNLWIIDDWGVISMKRDIAEEVFDLMDRRKQNSAMILTSNRDINEWGEMFPDAVLANATIDRIFDRANIVIFKGKSYRLKGRIMNKEIDELTKGK